MTQNYIVLFNNDATEEQIVKAKEDLTVSGGKVTQEYNMPGMKGFAGAIPDTFIEDLKSLQGDGVIDSIEVDGEMTIQQ